MAFLLFQQSSATKIWKFPKYFAHNLSPKYVINTYISKGVCLFNMIQFSIFYSIITSKSEVKKKITKFFICSHLHSLRLNNFLNIIS